MRTKNNFFAFRVKDFEAEKIRRNIEKSGLTQSDYLAAICLKGNVISSIDNAKYKAIMVELSRQGNNLNQMAKKLNSGKKVLAEDVEDLLKILAKTYEDIKQCLS